MVELWLEVELLMRNQASIYPFETFPISVRCPFAAEIEGQEMSVMESVAKIRGLMADLLLLLHRILKCWKSTADGTVRIAGLHESISVHVWIIRLIGMTTK